MAADDLLERLADHHRFLVEHTLCEVESSLVGEALAEIVDLRSRLDGRALVRTDRTGTVVVRDGDRVATWTVRRGDVLSADVASPPEGS